MNVRTNSPVPSINSNLIRNLTEFFDGLADSEFGQKIDRAILPQREDVLVNEIRRETRQIWSYYLNLFGFAWEDTVRVENKEEPTVELVPSSMSFAPYQVEPFAWLHGWGLKSDGKPGKKV